MFEVILRRIYVVDNTLSPKIKWIQNSITARKLKANNLKQSKETCTPANVVKLFIVYKSDTWSQDLNANYTLKECLFEAVKVTKNDDPDKYSYFVYWILFSFILQFQIWIAVEIFLFLE